MSILLHPNKIAPERYRVWDKMTRTQAYYPLTKQGLLDAQAHVKRLQEIKKAKLLKKQLWMNRLFDEEGRVRGLRRVYRKRADRAPYEALTVQITVNGIPKKREVSLNKHEFEEAWQRIQDWMIEQFEYRPSPDLRQAFKNAKRFYWHSVRE